MTIRAASATSRLRRSVSAWLGRSVKSPARDTCGLAPDVTTSQKPDGLRLMIRREVLAAEAKHARNLSRCKEASTYEAELRAVTLEILQVRP